MRSDTLTIAQGATTSGAIDLQGRSIVKIDFPTMTGTAVAIHEEDATGTYKAIGDETAAYSIAAPSGRMVHLAPSLTVGMGKMKLVSGSAEAAARSIVVWSESYTG